MKTFYRTILFYAFITPIIAKGNILTQELQNPTFQFETAKMDSDSLCSEVKRFENGLAHFTSNELHLAGVNSLDKNLIRKNVETFRVSLYNIDLNLLNKNCVDEIRKSSLAAKRLEDYLDEELLGDSIQQSTSEKFDFNSGPLPVMEDFNVGTRSLDGKKHIDLQEGDVLIGTGATILSGMITQLPEIPSPYAHAILVVKDSKTNKLAPREALVGSGVADFDFAKSLRYQYSRFVVVRPIDQELGKKSASAMEIYIRKMREQGKNPAYDYKFDWEDFTKMSCVELIYQAYKWGSDSKVILPQNPSRIEMKSEKFLQTIGQKNGEGFVPGDLEFDSHFKVVFEWKNASILRDERRKFVVMRKIFEWMDQDGYQLKSSIESTLASDLFNPLRNSEKLWNVLGPVVTPLTGEIAPGIPNSFVRVATKMNWLGGFILKELSKRDEDHIKKFGYAMSWEDLETELEKIRIDDQVIYDHGSIFKSQPNFHKYFAP